MPSEKHKNALPAGQRTARKERDTTIIWFKKRAQKERRDSFSSAEYALCLLACLLACLRSMPSAAWFVKPFLKIIFYSISSENTFCNTPVICFSKNFYRFFIFLPKIPGCLCRFSWGGAINSWAACSRRTIYQLIMILSSAAPPAPPSMAIHSFM